jgi:hypothetical protein
VDPRAKARFIDSYTNVLNQAWSSDEFVRRLDAEPQAVLAENGLATVVGGAVTIERSRDGDPDLDAQISLWEQGHATGRYVLYVPHTPQICTTELTEADLDDVSGGANDACCCCNPCCCQNT